MKAPLPVCIRENRMKKGYGKGLLKKCCAAFCAASLVLSGVPVLSFADQESSGTVSGGNGWVLKYESDGTQASIVDVDTVGNGLLTVPGVVEGSIPVTTLGTHLNEAGTGSEGVFQGQTSLKTIDLPESITSFGPNTFFNSGIQRIDIPVNLEGISANCFRGCSDLSDVKFVEGDTLGYIDERAFNGCTSLTSFTFPPLVGKSPSNSNYSVGQRAFLDCTGLTTFTFLPGGKNDASGYFAHTNCIDGCANLVNFIYYCKKATLSTGLSTAETIAASTYYTVDFYGSEDDASSGENRVARVTYPATTLLRDICQGTADISTAYEGSDAIPTAPEGKCWGISDGAITSESSALTDSYNAIAVEPDNVVYSWLTSPEIESYQNDDTVGLWNSIPKRSSRYYLNEDGKSVDLGNIHLYGPDFNIIDESKYDMSYEKRNYVPNMNSGNSYSPVSGVNSAGMFRLTATGKGQYSTHTETALIYVDSQYAPDSYSYAGDSISANTGKLASVMSENLSETPYFNVVAPSSKWQYGVIGSGLAGVGDGVLVFSDNNTDSAAFRALVGSRASSVNILGNESEVSKSVETTIKGLSTMSGGSVDRFTATSVQDLAIRVFNTIKTYGPDYGYDWGTTAIVASPVDQFTSSLASRYAYAEDAPVFFSNQDGSISNATMNALVSGGFTKILIAGDASRVSAQAASSISSRCSVVPQRILTSGSVVDNAIRANQLDGATPSSTVIAAADNPANVVEASVFAAQSNGFVYVVASSADAKRSLGQIAVAGKRGVSALYSVGDVGKLYSNWKNASDAFWSSGAVPAVSNGDTIEANGMLYRVTSGKTATLQKPYWTNSARGLSVSTVSYNGVSRNVATIASGAFTSARLGAVTLGPQVTSIGSRAFYGSSATSVSIGRAVKSIGAKAFENCKSLKTVACSSAQLTKLEESLFTGCTALTTASISSGKLVSVGSNAFSGCSSLSNVSMNSAALTSIGTGAFRGCAKLASMSIPSKRLKAVGESAFYGCKSLKRVALGSTALAAIGAKAFSGCSKLSSLNIKSKKLSKVGTQSFFGCKSLKTLTIKSKKLKKKGIGKKAFSKTPKKMKVRVPKSKVKAYKKLFTRAGLSKKAKFSKA